MLLRDDIPSRGIPWLSWSIISACVLCFLWQLSLPAGQAQSAVYTFGFIPARAFGLAEVPSELAQIPAWMTVVCSMFMHGGWLHLLGNLIYFWMFSDKVEDRLGRIRFAFFYLLCGIAAALAQALPSPDSRIPMIGASGALAGILGAYLMWFPRANILLHLPLGMFTRWIRLPAALVLGLWFALQLLAEMNDREVGIAFRAHIGGFLAGMLLGPLLAQR